MENPKPPNPASPMYQRKLPHFQRTGAIYFITWRLHPKQPDLRPEERDVVTSALHHFNGQRYDLLAFVVMNDHVHVLTRPMDGRTPENITHTWKSYTANHMQRLTVRSGRMWQSESYDRIPRDEVELLRVITYICNNPAKRWPSVGAYRWVWIAGGAEGGAV
jgi:REP-associated tyrosine transposase